LETVDWHLESGLGRRGIVDHVQVADLRAVHGLLLIISVLYHGFIVHLRELIGYNSGGPKQLGRVDPGVTFIGVLVLAGGQSVDEGVLLNQTIDSLETALNEEVKLMGTFFNGYLGPLSPVHCLDII
jgi:hypothetical protein